MGRWKQKKERGQRLQGKDVSRKIGFSLGVKVSETPKVKSSNKRTFLKCDRKKTQKIVH